MALAVALAVMFSLAPTSAAMPATGDASGEVFGGTLVARSSGTHLTDLSEGAVEATVAFGDRRSDGKLSVFDPTGRRIFERRAKGGVTFSGVAAEAGTYRLVVQAYSPLSYRLQISGVGVSAPSPAPDPSPSPAPLPEPTGTPGAGTGSGSGTGEVPEDATVFYVDAVEGRDGRDGRSPATAWRSLAAVNDEALPGNSAVLLRGGQTFPGTLNIGVEDGGTAARPLIIGSFGTGRATIDAGPGTGISVYNRGAVSIQDLRVVGQFTGSSNGVDVYSDLPGGVLSGGVTVRNVEVSGFRGWGVSVGSWAGRSGFRDVRFHGLDLHGNGGGGLLTYAQEAKVHENVHVTRSVAHDNPGYAGASGHTGNGFVLGGVSGGGISHSLAYRNGGANDVDAEGPVGIWTYESDRVVIEHNEAFDNRTGSRADGGGFDLDNGTTNSVLQYNYSHGNDGAGFLLWQTGAVASGGNTVRYNISENDGRRNGYGGITVGGASPGSRIHHNTVFSHRGGGVASTAVGLFDRASGYEFRNNLFVVDGGASLISATESGTAVAFRNNAYHASGGAFRVDWGRAAYNGLAPWRAATGQERDGADDLGMFADPRLAAPGSGGTIGDTARLGSLHAYHLGNDSPLRGSASSMSATARGERDFYGALVPGTGSVDIGAHQAS